MSWEKIRRKAAAPSGSPVNAQTVRRQLAWAAGAENFQNRDPLYHVTEDFHQTFDAMGRRHAADLAKADGRKSEEQEAPPEDRQTMPSDSARAFYERGTPEDQAMLHRFSETAFQRGTLSGAVLEGTGTMMLFSCLKKTIGQSQPDKWQQRKLFEKSAYQRNAAGRQPETIQFNRGFTDSAVALTVDVLRDSRRVVESLQEMAQGRSVMGNRDGATTLQKMYPFLDDTKERGLLLQYQSQLQEMAEGDPRRSVLQNAVARTRALVEKKDRMRLEFMNKLRFLSDRATETLEVFLRPEFVKELDASLRKALDAEEPPEDGGDDGEATGPADGASSKGGDGEKPDRPDT